MRPGRLISATILASGALAMLAAPSMVPHDAHAQYADFPSAPPMAPHLIDTDGTLQLPFVYPLQLTDRLARRYTEDRSRHIPISAAWRAQPIFFLGTDALGRDVFSRLLLGARASVGIAATATLGALLIGVAAGAVSGYAGGIADEVAMRLAEMVVVLPAIYVVLAMRAALPLVLEPRQVFVGVAAVLALVGWPLVARGVRAIVAVECSRDYVEAARACGASRLRVVWRHALPAAGGFISTQAALLIPAFIIGEATLSFAGFGFAEPTPSWGTMLQEAGSVSTFADHPWLLAPAAAIAAVSWAVHTAVGADRAVRARSIG